LSCRILTTHTGSLPRPPELLALIDNPDRAESFETAAQTAVDGCIRKQTEIGLDIVNDGELAKPSFATYVTDRLTGFAEVPRTRALNLEQLRYPDYYGPSAPAGEVLVKACVGPIAWAGDQPLKRELGRLRAALAGGGLESAFVSAASPGVVWYYQPNDYYRSHEEYLAALAAAMRHEYETIVSAGCILQLDCPDLAGGWTRPEFADRTIDDFRRFIELHVEALNAATRNIPPDRMRMHVCWGNIEGPHVRDIPLAAILDILLSARPAGLSIEGANPRHEHEWKVFQNVALPEGKYLIPGVIDSTTNYVEHPELVAERIERYASVVGPERVVAGVDCGFATLAKASPMVHPTIVWEKLQTLVEGARIASAILDS